MQGKIYGYLTSLPSFFEFWQHQHTLWMVNAYRNTCFTQPFQRGFIGDVNESVPDILGSTNGASSRSWPKKSKSLQWWMWTRPRNPQDSKGCSVKFSNVSGSESLQIQRDFTVDVWRCKWRTTWYQLQPPMASHAALNAIACMFQAICDVTSSSVLGRLVQCGQKGDVGWYIHPKSENSLWVWL